jgi:hypothetical protein
VLPDQSEVVFASPAGRARWISNPAKVKHFQQKEKVMPTVNSVMSRRLMIVLTLGGLALLPPVIAARWVHPDTGAAPAVEIRRDNKITAEPAKFEYFPAQYRNQSRSALPEPHIQAF